MISTGMLSGKGGPPPWGHDIMFWTTTIRNILGREAETRALTFLRHQGLRLVRRNYACKLGELDLVMSDKNVLVFVEVRHRTRTRAGSAEESIDQGKRRRLRRAAAHYMQTFGMTDTRPCRFDIITLHPDARGKVGIHWIENALGV